MIALTLSASVMAGSAPQIVEDTLQSQTNTAPTNSGQHIQTQAQPNTNPISMSSAGNNSNSSPNQAINQTQDMQATNITPTNNAASNNNATTATTNSTQADNTTAAFSKSKVPSSYKIKFINIKSNDKSITDAQCQQDIKPFYQFKATDKNIDLGGGIKMPVPQFTSMQIVNGIVLLKSQTKAIDNHQGKNISIPVSIVGVKVQSSDMSVGVFSTPYCTGTYEMVASFDSDK